MVFKIWYNLCETIDFLANENKLTTPDNHLDSYEEHMVRRIEDLIFVPHQDYIRTKLVAQRLNKHA